MRPTILGTAILAGLALQPAVSTAATADGFGLSVLLDGVPRPEYRSRGTVYVEAMRGRDYVLRITNPLPVRVAVALAVDGLNSIDARHTDAAHAAKWVLDPYETVEIGGWQVNGSEARRFFFTGERHSYGAQLGQTDDLGVIEAVFYREKTRPLPVHVMQVPRAEPLAGQERGADGGVAGGAPQAQSVPPAPTQGKSGSAGSAPAPEARRQSFQEQVQAAPSDEYAATGIGERTRHDVQWVDLELEKNPAARVRIRYEFRPQLVRLGVLPPLQLPSPLDRREGARGFSGRYCPDPPVDP